MSHHVVEVDGLSFSYPGASRALDGISFRIEHGRAVALVGANGAGKSTLLLTLVGFLVPSVGTIRIGGTTLTQATLREVRRAVGMVFQDPDDQLFMPTVQDDVAFGPLNHGVSRDECDRQVAAALERVGMSHLAGRPPHRLSAGEKRAVAIATVLVMQPDVLLMDEPTSNLDPRGRRRLVELLRSFGHTRIIATHDLEMVVELCDRVLLLDSGRIVADGEPRQVLNDEALMLAHGLERPHSLRHAHPH